MKKIVSIMLFATVLLSLAPCKGKKAKSYNVTLITMDQMDQHWQNVNKGGQKAAAELGNINFKWLAPSVKDDAQQIECINNAVAQGADAILIAANGPDSVTSALKSAQREGVKIIYVDSPANLAAEATFSTDNKAAGKTAGQEMLKELKAKGVSSGSIGIISVNPSTASTVAREEGFKEAFSGTAYTILATQYCDGDAARSKDAAANFITQGVVGLFGANEGSTVGVGNAIREAKASTVGVGFDKSDTILQQIEQGYLLCAMAQNPDVMGYEGVKAAATILSGKKIAKDKQKVDTGVSVISKSNIAQFK